MSPPPRPCRFGGACWRPCCAFGHPGGPGRAVQLAAHWGGVAAAEQGSALPAPPPPQATPAAWGPPGWAGEPWPRPPGPALGPPCPAPSGGEDGHPPGRTERRLAALEALEARLEEVEAAVNAAGWGADPGEEGYESGEEELRSEEDCCLSAVSEGDEADEDDVDPEDEEGWSRPRRAFAHWPPAALTSRC